MGRGCVCVSVPGTGVFGCRCSESSWIGESIWSPWSAERIWPNNKWMSKIELFHSVWPDQCSQFTCLTAVRLVSVPRPLLSAITKAWDSRLDEGYWGESNLLYTDDVGKLVIKLRKPHRDTLKARKKWCDDVAGALLWQGSGAMVAMKGLEPMWPWRCCGIGCCGEAWSCCWNEMGWRVVNPAPMLLMTGTAWGCVDAKPVVTSRSERCCFCPSGWKTQERNGNNVTNEKRGFAQTHDAGQGRHDEARRGCWRGWQAVQRCQRAYWWQRTPTGHLRPEHTIATHR